MIKINNAVTRLLHIDFPVISAPMANVAGAALASTVTRAGGLGMLGGGYCDAQWLAQELNQIAAKEFGIGFITWRLKQFPQTLALAIKHQPRAIMLSFGDIQPFVATIKSANIPLMCQVQTLKDAVLAKQHGADILIAQGGEAGGHGANRGTFALIPAIVDAVGDTPVIAAGGISDARGLAAAMLLGAQGALMGTRFMASEEALVTQTIKSKLINASGDDTVKTNVFDYARGYYWPQPYTARVIKNNFLAKWVNASDHLGYNEDALSINPAQAKGIQEEYIQALANNDLDTLAIFAGEGVDLIHEILPAGEIITIMRNQFAQITNTTLPEHKSKECKL